MFTQPATHVWEIPEPEPVLIPKEEPDAADPNVAEPERERENVPAAI